MCVEMAIAGGVLFWRGDIFSPKSLISYFKKLTNCFSQFNMPCLINCTKIYSENIDI